MKIQLALDLLDPKKALQVVEETNQYVDIIEIGTSLLKLEGIKFIDRIRKIATNKPIFIDMKIIDGPEREATLMTMFEVDYYSMLAVATDTAIQKVLNIANKTGAKVVFDMQSIDDYKTRALQLKQLGALQLCVHKNADCGANVQQAFKEFIEIKQLTNLSVSIAGDVNLNTLPLIKQQLNPDVVVIGGTILNAVDHHDIAKQLYQIATN